MAARNQGLSIDDLIRAVLADQYEFGEEDVRYHLYKARAIALLQIEKDLGEGIVVPKGRTSVFASLQLSVENHEKNHRNLKENPLEEMAELWRASVQRAQQSATPYEN